MDNKIAINAYLSTITLNANGSNAPIKRHMVVEWIAKKKKKERKKKDYYICCL